MEGREKRAIGGPGFFFLNETREKGERGLKKKHFINFTLCKRRAGLGQQNHGQGAVYVVGEEDARLKKRREKEIQGHPLDPIQDEVMITIMMIY